MDELPPYQPIACSLHDRIEDAAVRGRFVDIAFAAEDGTAKVVNDRIVDWFSRDGAEFLTTASGLMIRLDRLISVDGVAFR